MATLEEIEKKRLYDGHIRLFLDEVYCEVLRYEHAEQYKISPQDVEVWREVYLGESGSYADVFVQPGDHEKYYLEIKLGMEGHEVVEDLHREYGPDDTFHPGVSLLKVLVNKKDYSDFKEVEKESRKKVHPGLKLEFVDRQTVVDKIKKRYGVEVTDFTPDTLLEVRDAIDKEKWRYAFGDEHAESPLRDMLLWNFSSWHLAKIAKEQNVLPHTVLRPKLYKGVVILMADLCSFSSYVRDSRDPDFTRLRLETFYSKARTAIHNCGGMMYQIVGDEVVGIFGLHESNTDYMAQAVKCARALADIGYSVASDWQRGLDRVQNKHGVHMGCAIGDLSMVPFRPFSSTQVGFLGEGINLSARLMGQSGPGEMVMSNLLYERLPPELADLFVEMEPAEAKNMGSFLCWRMPTRQY